MRGEVRVETLVPAGGAHGAPRLGLHRRPVAGRVRVAALAIEARDIGELLDVATEVLRRRFAACLAATMLLLLPSIWLFDRIVVARVEAAVALRGELSEVPSVFVFFFAGCLAWMLVPAAVCPLAYAAVDGRRASFVNAILRLARRLPSLVLVSLTSAGLITMGLFSCGILSLLFGWRLALAQVVVLLEGPDPMRALVRSWRLTRSGLPRWFALALLAVAFAVPFWAGLTALSDPNSVLGRFLEQFPLTRLSLVGVIMALPMAFYGVVTTLLYVDARVRTEGYDLAAALHRIDAREKRGPGPVRTEGHGGLA